MFRQGWLSSAILLRPCLLCFCEAKWSRGLVLPALLLQFLGSCTCRQKAPLALHFQACHPSGVSLWQCFLGAVATSSPVLLCNSICCFSSFLQLSFCLISGTFRNSKLFWSVWIIPISQFCLKWDLWSLKIFPVLLIAFGFQKKGRKCWLKQQCHKVLKILIFSFPFLSTLTLSYTIQYIVFKIMIRNAGK